MNILTWNINFRGASPLDRLASYRPRPDIVTLQEVRLGQSEAVRERLHDMGYESVFSGHPNAVKKQYGNVIAARMPLTASNRLICDFPWSQLVAHARVQMPGGPVHVVSVHIPNGSGNGWKKIEAFEALKNMVLRLKRKPLILTGDFNEPYWGPLQDGQIVTWGQDTKDGNRWLAVGTWTDQYGVTDKCERWDAAVRWFFECQNESGLRVAFWDKAGHGAMEPSHLSRGKPRWFDHIFVSGAFHVKTCKYLHPWRKDGYSDHSPLVAELTYGPG